VVTCRFTHVYPDGPAPYFTVYAAGRRGAELEIWDEIKARASAALLDHGGTITHHHAVGRDHVPWYRPPAPFVAALRAVKHSLDPVDVLNPGVLGL
jgi:alkyldihydroxyacetonephosphate synthase